MGSVHSYQTTQGKRYLVRYKKPDLSQGNKRGFVTKRDAQEFLASVTASISHGEYIDPTSGRATVGELGRDWLQDQEAVLKPSAFHPIESAWRVHVEPRWGRVHVAEIRHSDVRSWVTDMRSSSGPVTVIRCYGILAAVLDVAVRDRRIAENPARGIRMPKKQPKRRVYLSVRQVELLASEATHPELIYFLCYTGLRWGEATGLRVVDVNTQRRRVHVQENSVMVGGKLHSGTPKTHATRSVPYPDFLDQMITILMRGKGLNDYLFGPGDSPLRLPNSQDGWFAGAVRRAIRRDPTFRRVTPHALRHTAASLAISAGANVKAVQRMLGHASAAMTLDTYADLFDDDLDAVSTAMSLARQRIIVVEHRDPSATGPVAQALPPGTHGMSR